VVGIWNFKIFGISSLHVGIWNFFVGIFLLWLEFGILKYLEFPPSILEFGISLLEYSFCG